MSDAPLQLLIYAIIFKILNTDSGLLYLVVSWSRMRICFYAKIDFLVFFWKMTTIKEKKLDEHCSHAQLEELEVRAFCGSWKITFIQNSPSQQPVILSRTQLAQFDV